MSLMDIFHVPRWRILTSHCSVFPLFASPLQLYHDTQSRFCPLTLAEMDVRVLTSFVKGNKALT